jgi:hypothetical protein
MSNDRPNLQIGQAEIFSIGVFLEQGASHRRAIRESGILYETT